MAKEYHNTPNGPRPCRVDKSNPNSRGCPLGGAHFDNFSDAMEAYSENLKETFGEFHVLVRPSTIEKGRRLSYKSLDSIEKVKASPKVSEAVQSFQIIKNKAREARSEIRGIKGSAKEQAISTPITEAVDTKPLGVVAEDERAQKNSEETFSPRRSESLVGFGSRVMAESRTSTLPFQTRPLDRTQLDQAVNAINARYKQPVKKPSVKARASAALNNYKSKVSRKVRTAKTLASTAIKDRARAERNRLSNADYAIRASASVAKDVLALQSRAKLAQAKSKANDLKSKAVTRAARMNVPAGHIRPGDTFDGTTVRGVESLGGGKLKISYHAKPGGPVLSTTVAADRVMSIDRKTRREARNARLASKVAKPIAQTREFSNKVVKASSNQLQSFKGFKSKDQRFASVEKAIAQEARIARQRELVEKLRSLRVGSTSGASEKSDIFV